METQSCRHLVGATYAQLRHTGSGTSRLHEPKTLYGWVLFAVGSNAFTKRKSQKGDTKSTQKVEYIQAATFDMQEHVQVHVRIIVVSVRQIQAA